ncbi:hypothetical protein C7212DRAFT_364270 [Tuber magnatum]|uniref:Uncharacterized protein n=1 Tax=Tuber magnatum TaxID=42249 RepID=A0A317SN63_9PEZI|nr:hypothetical protein C7212DRAFT_364270 [Tuber magnatum]
MGMGTPSVRVIGRSSRESAYTADLASGTWSRRCGASPPLASGMDSMVLFASITDISDCKAVQESIQQMPQIASLFTFFEDLKYIEYWTKGFRSIIGSPQGTIHEQTDGDEKAAREFLHGSRPPGQYPIKPGELQNNICQISRILKKPEGVDITSLYLRPQVFFVFFGQRVSQRAGTKLYLNDTLGCPGSRCLAPAERASPAAESVDYPQPTHRDMAIVTEEY